jgi:hypothetical protein
MAKEPPKAFGKRGIKPPPVITHAPDGLPTRDDERRRQIAVNLALLLGFGLPLSVVLIAAAVIDAARHPKCLPSDDPARQENSCGQGVSGHGGGGGGRSGGGSSSRAVSFGGFGGHGAAHGGGGGGE